MKRAAAMMVLGFRSTIRDPMLLLLTVLPLLLAPALRLGVPQLARLLGGWFDLASYFPLAVALFALMTPALIGWVTGFMLLDDRDEGVLAAIAVTPAGKKGFLLHRLAIPTVVSFGLGVVLLSLNGMVALPPWRLAAVVGLAALEAPMMALLLAAFAGNKVEGVAVAKALNLMFVGPFALVFAGFWWQFPAALLPPYWVAKLIVEPGLSPLQFAAALAAGLAVHAIFLLVGLRRFLARAD